MVFFNQFAHILSLLLNRDVQVRFKAIVMKGVPCALYLPSSVRLLRNLEGFHTERFDDIFKGFLLVIPQAFGFGKTAPDYEAAMQAEGERKAGR